MQACSLQSYNRSGGADVLPQLAQDTPVRRGGYQVDVCDVPLQ